MKKLEKSKKGFFYCVLWLISDYDFEVDASVEISASTVCLVFLPNKKNEIFKLLNVCLKLKVFL